MTDRIVHVPGTPVDTGELVHTAVAFLVPADFVAAWRAGGPQTSTDPAWQAGPAE